MIRRYLDFELHITSLDQELEVDINGRPYAINLPHPITVQPESPFPDWRKMGLKTPGLAGLGHALYDAFFVKEVATRFQAYLNRRGYEEGVRVCVHAQSSTVRGAFWEALCSQLAPTASYLALDPRTPVVRIARIGREVYLREMRLPLKLLVVLSSPRLVQRINPHEEKAVVEQALGQVVEKGLVEVEYLGFSDTGEANFETLQEHLATRDTPYDIVHIIGHGLLEAGEEGELALVDPASGRQQRVRASSLANLFCSRGVLLVILQACQSGAVDPSALYFSGVAQQLVASGVPAVLAMQENIDQDVARHFMERLYARWLGDRCLFEDSLTQARQSVEQRYPDRTGSWAIPVLYMCPGVQLLPVWAEYAEVVRERLVDAALPQHTRVGKETELIVLIRTPDGTGLREVLGIREQDFAAAPDDVRTSSVFDVPFPVDQSTGKVLPGSVRVVVATSSLLLDRSEATVQIRPQGDSVRIVFLVTPKAVGTARAIVRVVDTSKEQVTLAELFLKTQVQNGVDAFEAEYGVVQGYREAPDGLVPRPEPGCTGCNPMQRLLGRRTGAESESERLNLRGVNLRGAHLPSAYLRGADLQEASLRGANLRDATLSGADLQRADLTRVNLRGAFLNEANLNGADLQRADLARANLGGADLSGADLHGANLSRARLGGAKLDDSTQIDAKWRLVWEIVSRGGAERNLCGADLREAYLNGANLSKADLCEANLSGADLTGVDLSGANLNGANLSGATLSRAKLNGASLDSHTQIDDPWRLVWELATEGGSDRDLSGADLAHANLSRVDLRKASLERAKLYSADLRYADLEGAKLSQASLRRTDLTGACLRRTNLTGADLTLAKLSDASLDGADLAGACLYKADLTGADLHGADLTGADLTRADLEGAGLRNTIMPDGKKRLFFTRLKKFTG